MGRARARQEASLGHEAAARRSLERALATAERDPERLNLFAPDKDSRWLARRPAYVALRLGHAQEAVALLERNRAQADERLPRELVWNSVELGEAWALAGDLDSALAYLGDGLDRAVSSEDRHGLRSLRRVRADLNRWAGDLRLRQFDDRLREVAL